ncbi:MAG TPA: inositol monophosphatase family protein [Opitutales bacterium]|nr:inositol monophosphatase family protein [Opitutales bacterium]
MGRALVKGEVDFFRRQFANVESEWKEDHSRVTFADYAISGRIMEALAKEFPKDDLCTEETDPREGPRPLKAHYAWFLDPVDGTNNFALGLPSCAISLGLLMNGKPVYGFIYDFGRDRIMEGGPGIGIVDGDRTVKGLADRALEDKTIIGLAFPLKGPYAAGLHELAGQFNIRSLGSGALTLSYVALGLLDGCIDLRSKSWDVAAALALCGASDAKVRYLDGPHFPLREFDVHQSPSPFYAGTAEFCAACEKVFGK